MSDMPSLQIQSGAAGDRTLPDPVYLYREEREIHSFMHTDMVLVAPTNIIVACGYQPQKIGQLCIRK